MKMKTGIIFVVFCVMSIDCAPKSKHYLVKVRDNDDGKMKVEDDSSSNMKVDDILENISDGETSGHGQDDYSDRD